MIPYLSSKIRPLLFISSRVAFSESKSIQSMISSNSLMSAAADALVDATAAVVDVSGAAGFDARDVPVSARFGFLVVNMLWLTLGLAGAVPFYASSLDLDLDAGAPSETKRPPALTSNRRGG